MLILNKNILTIGGNRLEGGPLTPPTPPGPSFDEVTIGTQTWMAKNLAIDDGGTGIDIKENVTANGVNFGTQYYYTWDAAVRVANSISGWHLPTIAEWDTLAISVGGSSVAGTKLKSTTGWNNAGNGTDDYGFTVLPNGYFSYGSINYLGMKAYFWTSQGFGANAGYYSSFEADKSNITQSNFNKSNGCSVRLIKDT